MQARRNPNAPTLELDPELGLGIDDLTFQPVVWPVRVGGGEPPRAEDVGGARQDASCRRAGRVLRMPGEHPRQVHISERAEHLASDQLAGVTDNDEGAARGCVGDGLPRPTIAIPRA